MHFVKIGSGYPIVFLHGWGCDGTVFLPIAQKLSGCECYLLDFNGFGQTPPPPKDGWNVDDYAENLAHFFKTNNLQRVCIVGHSFGCRVAMVFAAKYPQCVDKMLLVAPAGLRTFSMSRWLKVRKYKFTKFLCRLGLCHNLNQRFGSVDYNACDDGMKNTFVKVVNQDLSNFAKIIRCPTLIVNGRTDTATPLKNAKRLQKLISDAHLAEIDGEHFAFFQNPTAFAKTIQYFVEGES